MILKYYNTCASINLSIRTLYLFLQMWEYLSNSSVNFLNRKTLLIIYAIPINNLAQKSITSSTHFFRSRQFHRLFPSYNVDPIELINKQTSKLSSAISLVYRGRLEIFPFIEIFSPLPTNPELKLGKPLLESTELKEERRGNAPVQRVGKKLDLANTASKGLAKRPIKSSLLIRRALQIFS